MPLTSADLWNLAAKYFGDLGPQAVATAYNIAIRESGGNPAATNINPLTRDDSHGLMQINIRPDANPQFAGWNLNDPDVNFYAARLLYNQAGGFTPWSTYRSGEYAGEGIMANATAYPASMTYTGGRTPTPNPGTPGFPGGYGGGAPRLDPVTLQAIANATGLDTPTIQTVIGQALQQRAMDTLRFNQEMALGPASTTGVYPSELTGGQAGTYTPTMGALDLLSRVSGPADFLKYGAFANQLLGNRPGAENPWLRYNADLRGGGGGTSTPSAPTTTPATVPSVLFNGEPQHDANLEASMSAVGGTAQAQKLDPYREMANQQRAAGVPQLAFGGMSNAAVVGDPQHSNEANPELAMSAAPITVIPLNQMPDHLSQFASNLPHMATGGMVDFTQAPFMQRLQSGGPAFGGSQLGEAWGQQPFSYANYQRLLPSEQQMVQGYVNTPKALGGLGGFFQDELERARQAAFLGSPYQSLLSSRGETYG